MSLSRFHAAPERGGLFFVVATSSGSYYATMFSYLPDERLFRLWARKIGLQWAPVAAFTDVDDAGAFAAELNNMVFE